MVEYQKDLVSIIVPVYNSYQYLHKCINSLIEQTYKKIEIILINDGSTDESEKLCMEYAQADKRIVVISQSNKGASVARNAGLDAHKGEFVVFVDADDYVDEDYVNNLYKLMSDNCDIAITQYTHEAQVNDNYEPMVVRLTNKEALINMLLANHFDSSVCSKMVRSKNIETLRFDEELAIAEDLFFFFYILNKIETVCFSNIPDYHYIKRLGSSIETLNELKVIGMNKFEELIAEVDDSNIREALISKYISTCFHLLSLRNKNEIDTKSLVLAIKKYRKSAILGKYVARKVRIASLISYLGFKPVLFLLSARNK